MMRENYIADLPRRWGAALSARIERGDFSSHMFDIVHRVQTDDIKPLPVNANEEAIHCAADIAARECYRYAERYQLASLVIDGIFLLCERMGVPRPVGATEREIIARAVDKLWWLRQLRKVHARSFEHVAIQLEFVSRHAGPYISDESARRQAMRNSANAVLMQKTEVKNEFGQQYTLAELAALGVANKEIRRGELMTRIRGFEEIATDMNHVAMFWTITAPSKYHAVISETGRTNPKYVAFGSPTPRDAQQYLQGVWKCIRSALHRKGIKPYGLRIAEPHHDGCPHWHMMLFVAPEHAEEMERIVRKYALEEDGNEAGAQANRVKLVRIESSRGTASGYVVKYICKNVDGNGVGDHLTLDGYTIRTNDLFGTEELTPSQRVTYWSQLHGIRQFQQIGGAPVGVWRELRRIEEETARRAHPDVWAAWLACQKIDGGPEIAKQASWADYLRAQGGPVVGRGGMVQLAKRMTVVEGRYGTYEQGKPCGVCHAKNENAVYESVRYQWERVEPVEAVAVPRTGVNNCTQVDYPDLQQRIKEATERAKAGVLGKKFSAPAWVDWPEIKRSARDIVRESEKFAYRRNHAV